MIGGGNGMSHKLPDNVRSLRGNPGKQPVSDKAHTSTTGSPLPPPELRGEAFAEWARVVSFLEKVGHVESIDRAALVVYCTAWSIYLQALKAMELGPLVEGRDGNLVKNPAAQIMRDQSDIMLKYGAKFGFTPKDRVNLGIKNEAPEEDDGMLSGAV